MKNKRRVNGTDPHMTSATAKRFSSTPYWPAVYLINDL
jgi:hypothetical protein